MRHRKQTRLQTFGYVGQCRYSFTLLTYRRRRYFLDATVVRHLITQILQLGGEAHIEIPAYCFMPDHLHLFAIGRRIDADARGFVARFKQASGYWFSRAFHGNRLWHRGSWDRILRDAETPEVMIRYILMNPVRAEMVTHPLDYRCSGSLTLSRDILEAMFPRREPSFDQA
jgi:REP element-mobilizing transposase RayT